MDELCNPKEWTRVHFGNADFPDARLNKRALIIAEKLIENPKPNIHQLFYNDKDAILAYRFMDNDKTDYLSVTLPHRNVVMQRIRTLGQNAKEENSKKPMVLLLGDSSDVIFSYKCNIKNAGPIGKKNKGKGFILHPNLAVEWETKQILGVVSVDIRDRIIRKKINGKVASTAQRAKDQNRESKIWSDSIKQIGTAPDGVQMVCVNDRGADIYEYFCTLTELEYSYVIRASVMDRVVLDPNGTRCALRECAQNAPLLAEYMVEVTQQIRPYREL